MEKQSGGELASTDAAAGAQDAALQELWLSAEIPVGPCSRLQHLQRPTPSHLGSDTPDATRRRRPLPAKRMRAIVRVTTPSEPLGFVVSGTTFYTWHTLLGRVPMLNR